MSADRDRSSMVSVPAECRAALRELLPAGGNTAESQEAVAPHAAQHVAQCTFCSARMRAAAPLARLLVERPVVPAVLRSQEMLERIYEDVVESVEEGPIGNAIEHASVPVPAEHDQPKLEEVVGSGARDEISARLARQVVAGGGAIQPHERVWDQVRESILQDVSATVSSRTRRMPNPLLLVGIAASAMIGLMILSEVASSNGTSEQPAIVFTELERPPDVEFAIVRYGPRR